jgi:hypothetical protein
MFSFVIVNVRNRKPCVQLALVCEHDQATRSTAQGWPSIIVSDLRRAFVFLLLSALLPDLTFPIRLLARVVERYCVFRLANQFTQVPTFRF